MLQMMHYPHHDNKINNSWGPGHMIFTGRIFAWQATSAFFPAHHGCLSNVAPPSPAALQGGEGVLTGNDTVVYDTKLGSGSKFFSPTLRKLW
jgi:hypothetical protein